MKLGIIIKIENEKINNLVTNLEKNLSLELDNVKPHITLYSLESLDKLKEIKEDIERLLKKYKQFKLIINGFNFTKYLTLQLVFQYSKELNKLHYDIVTKLSKYIDKKIPSKPKLFYNTFSQEERKLIDLYGRPNVLENFKPHITLGKFKKEKQKYIEGHLSTKNINLKLNIITLKLIDLENFETLSEFKLN